MYRMVPVPVNTTEEIRRTVWEDVHRRNRPASINCFERTQTLIRAAATAVSRKIKEMVHPHCYSFRSGIASPVDNDYQQSTNSSINKVWGSWRASVNKRRGNPIHPGSYLWPHVLLYIIASLLAFWTFLSKLWS